MKRKGPRLDHTRLTTEPVLGRMKTRLARKRKNWWGGNQDFSLWQQLTAPQQQIPANLAHFLGANVRF